MSKKVKSNIFTLRSVYVEPNITALREAAPGVYINLFSISSGGHFELCKNLRKRVRRRLLPSFF